MTTPANLSTDIASEYRAATEAAAVHDTSNVGRLNATGADTLDLLNRLSTNQVLGLEPGQGTPTVLTTDRGRILDLISVVNLADYVLLLTSPGEQQSIIEWLDKYTIMEDLTVEDITGEMAMLTIIGPTGQSKLEGLTGLTLGGLPPYHTVAGAIAGQNVRIVHRPQGKLASFDLLLAPAATADVGQHLANAGITSIGAEAYEAVRIRQAIPVYGKEMGDRYNPLEAGLIGSIDFHKGCYIGQEVIARLDTYQKVQKRLVMLRFSADATIPEGTSLQKDGREVGSVTSVSKVPTTGELIGLGYVRAANAQVATQLELVSPAQGEAEIAELPQLFGPGEG